MGSGPATRIYPVLAKQGSLKTGITVHRPGPIMKFDDALNISQFLSNLNPIPQFFFKTGSLFASSSVSSNVSIA